VWLWRLWLLNTAISAASSKVQGATGAVVTAISDITNITAINAMIPRNCLLGTKQFCIGFDTNTTCYDLPLNISNIVPEAVVKFVSDEVKSLQPLEGILAKVTLASIQGWVILGLIFILFGVEEGPLGNLSMGALICAGAIMLLTIIISIFM
jgi:hypothetical protein